MQIRNKLSNFTFTPGKSKSKDHKTNFGNTQGSLSLNDFDQLPPQSPNLQSNRSESNQSTSNNNGNWKFFKKINI